MERAHAGSLSPELVRAVKEYADFWNERTLRRADVLEIAGLKRSLLRSWRNRGLFKPGGHEARALYSPRNTLEIAIVAEGVRAGLRARTVWKAVDRYIDRIIMDQVRCIAVSGDESVPWDSSDVIEWFPESSVVSLIKVAEIRDLVWRRTRESLRRV